MKKMVFAVLMIVHLNLTASTSAPSFNLCKNKYALCTTALCEPIPGRKDFVSCKCDVKEGYSAGEKPCNGGYEIIYSRYYPIKGYISCENNRPWAWCLDMPCSIDKNDASKASCTCAVVSNQGPYVIVANNYSKSACTEGLYSSATITQVNQVTDFLKGQNELKPFPIKVFKDK
ncbi:hypothetical protein [Legionella sp. 29fVS95]|uniref:hypothetical protein n=1 Tax=Legionella sp. 29fVS95 TaxID=3402813 RepID=UPI003AF4202A